MSDLADRQEPAYSETNIRLLALSTCSTRSTGVGRRAPSIDGPLLGRTISNLGILQLVCGVLMTFGMILYLGLLLGQLDRTKELFGCYVVDNWKFSQMHVPYSVTIVIIAGLVSLILIYNFILLPLS